MGWDRAGLGSGWLHWGQGEEQFPQFTPFPAHGPSLGQHQIGLISFSGLILI